MDIDSEIETKIEEQTADLETAVETLEEKVDGVAETVTDPAPETETDSGESDEWIRQAMTASQTELATLKANQEQTLAKLETLAQQIAALQAPTLPEVPHQENADAPLEVVSEALPEPEAPAETLESLPEKQTRKSRLRFL